MKRPGILATKILGHRHSLHRIDIDIASLKCQVAAAKPIERTEYSTLKAADRAASLVSVCD
jgi:hypothetical protein